MKRWIAAYVAGLVVFCAVDFAWLGLVMQDFYRAQLGALLLPAPKLLPGVLFYLLYMAGLVVFAVRPAISSARAATPARLGALFGLFCYATYDLTNLATLQGWSPLVTAVDIGWGMLLSAVVATSAWFAARKFG
ncbi:MAG TPA: DUF2177 family protein [Burkholderiaceae bacterium]